jgi:hypothetical protein
MAFECFSDARNLAYSIPLKRRNFLLSHQRSMRCSPWILRRMSNDLKISTPNFPILSVYVYNSPTPHAATLTGLTTCGSPQKERVTCHVSRVTGTFTFKTFEVPPLCLRGEESTPQPTKENLPRYRQLDNFPHTSAGLKVSW